MDRRTSRQTERPRRARSHDVDVVGSGPNGLSAAISLARQGFSVRVHEFAEVPGGGCKTVPLAGLLHGERTGHLAEHAELLSDPCSAVHPLALASPFFRSLGLERHGLEYLHAPYPLGHLVGPGRSAVLPRELQQVGEEHLGSGRDARVWSAALNPLAVHADEIAALMLSDGRAPGSARAAAGNPAAIPALGVGGVARATAALGHGGRMLYSELRRHPESSPAALMAGLAVHAIAPPARPVAFGAGLLLGATLHGRGWPVPRGGSGALLDALLAELDSWGGSVDCGARVDSLDRLEGRAVILAVGAAEARRILAHSSGVRVPRAEIPRGGGAARVDFVLSGPVPWRDRRLEEAGTLHLTGTATDAGYAEREVVAGRLPARPAILASQPWAADHGRIATDGRRVLWTYAHVPNGNRQSVADAIAAEIEAHASGFGDVVLTRVERGTAELESANPSYPGGDIAAGAATIPGMAFRYARSMDPYSAGTRGVWLASASTPPGPGVHGMAGAHAARRVAAALRSGCGR
ncbi:phytoene desaturase family protein [Dietzia sp.]|uniref:phytoene desaturase family protein n=1 Tax=Dietzia sp. TaxID=1871616 RepID=UPI002FD8E8C4